MVANKGRNIFTHPLKNNVSCYRLMITQSPDTTDNSGPINHTT